MDERPGRFRCDKCIKAYTRKANLLDHIQSAHLDAPVKLPCAKCKKTFLRKSDRDRHERLQHGEHKHVCGERPEHRGSGCGKAFARLDALNEHRRTRICAANTKRKSPSIGEALYAAAAAVTEDESSSEGTTSVHDTTSQAQTGHAHPRTSSEVEQPSDPYGNILYEPSTLLCPDPLCKDTFKSEYERQKHVSERHSDMSRKAAAEFQQSFEFHPLVREEQATEADFWPGWLRAAQWSPSQRSAMASDLEYAMQNIAHYILNLISESCETDQIEVRKLKRLASMTDLLESLGAANLAAKNSPRGNQRSMLWSSALIHVVSKIISVITEEALVAIDLRAPFIASTQTPAFRNSLSYFFRHVRASIYPGLFDDSPEGDLEAVTALLGRPPDMSEVISLPVYEEPNNLVSASSGPKDGASMTLRNRIWPGMEAQALAQREAQVHANMQHNSSVEPDWAEGMLQLNTLRSRPASVPSDGSKPSEENQHDPELPNSAGLGLASELPNESGLRTGLTPGGDGSIFSPRVQIRKHCSSRYSLVAQHQVPWTSTEAV